MRKIGIDGKERYVRTGTKPAHIKNLQQYSLDFISNMYAPWIPEVTYYMQQLLTDMHMDEESATKTIATISQGVIITQAILRTEFADSFYVSAIMALFQKRDAHIAECHASSYSLREHYVVYGRSLFLDHQWYSTDSVADHDAYSSSIYIPLLIDGWWTFIKFDKLLQ